MQAPFIPEINDKLDVSYFNQKNSITQQRATRINTSEKNALLAFNNAFEGFDYCKSD